MTYELVLSGNRILAHGEEGCFLTMGGTVICESKGKAYQNATVAIHEGSLPADIDAVGYEYHAGVFVPCAPYGMGDGNGYLMEMCTDCATPKNSGIKVKELRWQTLGSVVCSASNSASNSTTETFAIPVSASVLGKYFMLRYKIKAGSLFNFSNYTVQVKTEGGETQHLIYAGTTHSDNAVYSLTAPYTSGANAVREPLSINFTEDLALPAHMFSRCRLNRGTVSGATEVNVAWYSASGAEIDPLTIVVTLPNAGSCNLTIELEGLRGGCEI